MGHGAESEERRQETGKLKIENGNWKLELDQGKEEK